MAPKKTRKKASFGTTKLEELSSSMFGQDVDSTLPKAEKINIEQLFAKALKRYYADDLADKKDKEKELLHLATIIEEYLSCYMLIGYTLQNEQTVIFNANTSKDEAALVDLLRATFVDIANKRP
jgi:hypothetical protein